MARPHHPARWRRTALAVVLAYAFALQAALSLGMAAQRVADPAPAITSGVICPGHVEAGYLHPDQPLHAEHVDHCCVGHGGLAHALAGPSPAEVVAITYTEGPGSIRAPPLAPPNSDPRSPPVGSRAPPCLG